MAEIDRICGSETGNRPPPVEVWIDAYCSNPSESLERVESVILIIIEASNMEWPEDLWWEQKLPKWFLDTFNHTLDEIKKDPNLWDFGSWIDANKYRGWEWWSSNVRKSGLHISLWAYGDPYVTGPLEYLIRASGGVDIEVREVL